VSGANPVTVGRPSNASATGAGGRRYWIGVAAYVVVLLTIQSAMGYGIDLFKELWGEVALDVVAYVIVGAGALGTAWIGWRVWARCSVVERAWIGIALIVYAVGTSSARYPQERLHYLGYGLLAALLYVGFAGPDDDPAQRLGPAWAGSALLALVVGSLIGYGDELLQILWPRRYFDWADVAMNVVAVGFGLLVAIPVWNGWRRSG
jgi:hypothetical protein